MFFRFFMLRYTIVSGPNRFRDFLDQDFFFSRAVCAFMGKYLFWVEFFRISNRLVCVFYYLNLAPEFSMWNYCFWRSVRCCRSSGTGQGSAARQGDVWCRRRRQIGVPGQPADEFQAFHPVVPRQPRDQRKVAEEVQAVAELSADQECLCPRCGYLQMRSRQRLWKPRRSHAAHC